MRNALTIGLIGGLLYLGSRAWGAKRLSDKSNVRAQNPRISKISLSGISLTTDVLVDNPTNASVSITKPVITFSSGGNYIASSVPSRETFSIAPLQQTPLGSVQVDVPWSALAPYIANLMSRIPALTQNNSAKIESLGMPLEYSYSVYVNGLLYESQPERLV